MVTAPLLVTLAGWMVSRWKVNLVGEYPAAPRSDAGHARLARQHVSPLPGLVPVEFAAAVGFQAHVDPGEVLGHAQVLDVDLPGPAGLGHFLVRERKWIFERLDVAVVGVRRDRGLVVLAFEAGIEGGK